MKLNVRDKKKTLPIRIVSYKNQNTITLMINKRAAALLPKHGFMYFHLRFVLSAMIHYIVSTFSPTNLLSLFIHLTNMLVYFARCTYVFFIFFSCSVPITLVCFCSLYCVGHHFQKGAKCHPQSQFF